MSAEKRWRNLLGLKNLFEALRINGKDTAILEDGTRTMLLKKACEQIVKELPSDLKVQFIDDPDVFFHAEFYEPQSGVMYLQLRVVNGIAKVVPGVPEEFPESPFKERLCEPKLVQKLDMQKFIMCESIPCV